MENKEVFQALAVLEEAVKVAEELNKTADKAIRAIPEKIKAGVEAGVEAGSRDALKIVEKRVLSAQSTLDMFEQAEARLKRLGGILSVFLLCLSLLLVTAVFILTKASRDEAAQLKSEIAVAKQTLKMLENKTWGLELAENKGEKWIILKKGDDFLRTGQAGEQNAVKIGKK